MQNYYAGVGLQQRQEKHRCSNRPSLPPRTLAAMTGKRPPSTKENHYWKTKARMPVAAPPAFPGLQRSTEEGQAHPVQYGGAVQPRQQVVGHDSQAAVQPLQPADGPRFGYVQHPEE